MMYRGQQSLPQFKAFVQGKKTMLISVSSYTSVICVLRLHLVSVHYSHVDQTMEQKLKHKIKEKCEEYTYQTCK